jgi:WD40 repeat protein
MKFFLSLLAVAGISAYSTAQVVLVPPAKTITTGKSEVTCLAIAPKGDRILVGTSNGAQLFDLEKGKRVATFPYAEDGSNVVYYAAFNENGEYVVLIGFAGTREVWDVKTGKQDKMLREHPWIPDAIRTRELGLKKGNSDFDRFYQQTEAEHGGFTAKAGKEGDVVFLDADGNAVQNLTWPETKDKQHRAPCLFYGNQFITGTDNGRVLFYDLAKP